MTKEEELALVLRYAPHFMFDDAEPFEISAVGYTLFTETKQSDSFPKRVISVEGAVKLAIEYAVWFDYDIEHLYELEHVWVYLDEQGNLLHAESSFHGKYLNALYPEATDNGIEGKTHVRVYAQPGKHAFLPDPKLFCLVPGFPDCCTKTAGCAGVLVQEQYKDLIAVDDLLQEQTEAYIKNNYSFTPTMRFHKVICKEELFMPWAELKESIPERVKKQIEIIRAYAAEGGKE